MSSEQDPQSRILQAMEIIKQFQDNPEKWTDDKELLEDPKHADIKSILEALITEAKNTTISLNNDLNKNTAIKKSQESGIPKVIGQYRILELIGEGGFGIVYKAEQRGNVRRKVAVKVIKKGMDTQQVLARFDAEKNALSIMNHQNIARVIDSGETLDGQPYFVMEYVDGTPITTYCERERLSIKERLQLLQQVCKGVQHAHSKAIVHRDLKPGNILVTRIDGLRVVKIIDFGLVKALAGTLTDMTVITQQRQIVGTLEYMSPEQARSGGSDIDTKTDVYAIGVILYELLVNVRPFDARIIGDLELLRLIEEEVPQRPSQKFRSLNEAAAEEAAQSRNTNSIQLPKILNSELDWIALKALEKKREDRYETPLDLSKDLDRYLNGHEAVQARPPSRTYQIRKFTKRYRSTITAIILVFVALLSGTSWALIERDNAQTKANNLQQIVDFQDQHFASVDLFKFGQNIRRSILDTNVKAEISDHINDINFTDIAKKTIRENIILENIKLIDNLKSQPLVQAQLYQSIANSLINIGLFEDAIKPQKSSLMIRRKNLGDSHHKTLESKLSNANLLKLTGKVKEAGKLYDDTLAACRLHLGNDHEISIKSIHAAGAFYLANKELDKAQLLLEEARIRYDIQLNKQGLNTFRVDNSLAILHARKGDELTSSSEARLEYKKAKRFYLNALSGLKDAVGENHPETLNLENNFGSFLSRQSDFEEAEIHLSRALEGRKRVLGEDHPLTINSLYSYFRLHVDKYRNYKQQSKESQKKAQVDHFSELAKEELNKAGKLIEDIIKKRIDLVTRKHPSTAQAIRDKGSIYTLNKEYELAAECFKNAYEIQQEIYPVGHEYTKKTMKDLIRTYEILEDHQRAKDIRDNMENIYGKN